MTEFILKLSPVGLNQCLRLFSQKGNLIQSFDKMRYSCVRKKDIKKKEESILTYVSVPSVKINKRSDLNIVQLARSVLQRSTITVLGLAIV